MSGESTDRPQPGWIGPVLGWEMIRLGRRGTTTWMRIFVAILLLGALWAVYLARFPEEAIARQSQADISKEMAEFTQTFAYVFLMAQLGLICLLTPIYVAGAIGEERDRKTLEFLLATDLSNWEIIAGKLGSRIMQLLGILLVGIPVIAMTQVWGGVDIRLILLGYGITLLTLFAVGGICVACAAIPGTLRMMVIRSFGFVILFQGLIWPTSPFRILTGAFDEITNLVEWKLEPWMEAWRFTKYQLTLGFLGILLSVYWLRKLAFDREARRKRPMRSLPVSAKPQPKPLSVGIVTGGWDDSMILGSPLAKSEPPPKQLRHWADPPPLKDKPLYWKEVHFGGHMNLVFRLLALVPSWLWTLIAMTLSAVAYSFTLETDFEKTANFLARLLSAVFLFGTCVAIGLSAAGSISRERQQQTIVDLLMIPRPRSHFLLAKWFAALRKGIGPFCAMVSVLLGAIFVQGLHFVAIPFLVLAALIYACFSASLGLYLSVRCKTVIRASSLWMLIVLLLVGGTYLFAESQIDTRSNSPFSSRNRNESPYPVWDRIVNPILAWNQLAFREFLGSGSEDYYYSVDYRWGRLRSAVDLLVSLYGLMLYAGLAWLFWWLALARFENEGQQ